MTEDEATTKWCPFAAGKFYARYEGQNPNVNCIGSGCMAWRWDMVWEGAVEEGHGGDTLARMKRLKDDEPKRGYCGLAAKP